MKLVNIGEMGVLINVEKLKNLTDIDGYINDIALMNVELVIRQQKSDLVVSPEDLIEYLQGLKNSKQVKSPKKVIRNKKSNARQETGKSNGNTLLLEEYKNALVQLMRTVENLKSSNKTLPVPDKFETTDDVFMVKVDSRFKPFIEMLAEDKNYSNVIHFLLAKGLFGDKAKEVVEELSPGLFDKLMEKF